MCYRQALEKGAIEEVSPYQWSLAFTTDTYIFIVTPGHPYAALTTG